MDGENRQTALDLMQPEILSEDVLKRVLAQRLPSADLCGCPKTALVELWHRLVTPQPQRRYPDTQAGLRYAARQRTHRPPDPDLSDWMAGGQLQIAGTSQSSLPSSAVSTCKLHTPTLATPGGDRLKPPPLVVGEKRIIKLGAKRAPENSLDSIVIKRRAVAGRVRDDGGAAGDAATLSQITPGSRLGNDVPLTEPKCQITETGTPQGTCAVSRSGGVAEAALSIALAGSSETNGETEDADSDIKQRLKLEKRKIKRRKLSVSAPDLNQKACGPAASGSPV